MNPTWQRCCEPAGEMARETGAQPFRSDRAEAADDGPIRRFALTR